MACLSRALVSTLLVAFYTESVPVGTQKTNLRISSRNGTHLMEVRAATATAGSVKRHNLSSAPTNESSIHLMKDPNWDEHSLQDKDTFAKDYVKDEHDDPHVKRHAILKGKVEFNRQQYWDAKKRVQEAQTVVGKEKQTHAEHKEVLEKEKTEAREAKDAVKKQKEEVEDKKMQVLKQFGKAEAAKKKCSDEHEMMVKKEQELNETKKELADSKVVAAKEEEEVKQEKAKVEALEKKVGYAEAQEEQAVKEKQEALDLFEESLQEMRHYHHEKDKKMVKKVEKSGAWCAQVLAVSTMLLMSCLSG